jgi:hypothetical protein
MSQEPHTPINCVYTNTKYKDVVTAAFSAYQANVNPSAPAMLGVTRSSHQGVHQQTYHITVSMEEGLVTRSH